MKDGFLTVWTHSQNAYDLRLELTYLLGMPKQKMRVIHKDGPGCYGHNGADDAGADAALIASRVPGPPIRVQWSRRDEFQSRVRTPSGPNFTSSGSCSNSG